MDKHSRLNRIFRNMKNRCYNPKDSHYKFYGAKGIIVCNEWNNREIVTEENNSTKGYLAFKEWALENGYKDNLTIDRIDVNKNYSPANCRWITIKEQNNNKTNNHYITYKGETKTLRQWCDTLNLNYWRVKSRLNMLHWSTEKAFETEINCIK